MKIILNSRKEYSTLLNGFFAKQIKQPIDGILWGCILWMFPIFVTNSIMFCSELKYNTFELILWLITNSLALFQIVIRPIISIQTPKRPYKFRIRILTDKQGNTFYCPQYKNILGIWIYSVSSYYTFDDDKSYKYNYYNSIKEAKSHVNVLKDKFNKNHKNNIKYKVINKDKIINL